MQEKLTIVKEWMETNCMKVNASKCGIMTFPPRDIEHIKYGTDHIQYTEKYTYLGVEINDALE